MLLIRWTPLCLPFFYVILVAASPAPMSSGEIESYISKKLQRNASTLKLNKKLLGNEGLKVIARSPLLKKVAITSADGQAAAPPKVVQA